VRLDVELQIRLDGLLVVPLLPVVRRPLAAPLVGLDDEISGSSYPCRFPILSMTVILVGALNRSTRG
jgi:hypothetical protein